MPDKPKGKEGEEAPLERHLFAAGGDVNTAEAKLKGLLSEDDLNAGVLTAAGTEKKGDPPAKEKAPPPGEGETGEEGGADDDPVVDDDKPPLGEEHEEEEEEELEGDEEYEWEYVDPEGKVIEGPGEEAPETYTVLVDGKEHEVTLEELTSSFSFSAHNTRKSQELAATRKEVDDAAVAGRESRERYGQGLKQLGQALASLYPKEPDWDTLEVEDPAAYAVESAKWDRHRRKMDAVKAESDRVETERVADYTKQLDTYKVGEERRMLEAIPEWADPAVASAEQARLVTHAVTKLGFSEEEIDSILDHRAVVVLRKAMLLDELEAKGRKAVKKKKGGPTVPLKPGIRRRRRKVGAKRTVAARKRLSETGSVKDATRLLEGLLPDDA